MLSSFKKVLYSEKESVISIKHRIGKYDNQGATGLVYSYNKLLLDQIVRFPKALKLGGFDHYLYMCLLKEETEFCDAINKLENETIQQELIDFYNRIKHVKVDYLNEKIYTYEHGLLHNRKYDERISYYKNIDNPEIIENYFEQRKEDETYDF